MRSFIQGFHESSHSNLTAYASCISRAIETQYTRNVMTDAVIECAYSGGLSKAQDNNVTMLVGNLLLHHHTPSRQ